MKFSSGVDLLSEANRQLRFAARWLLASVFVLGILLAAESARKPVYLERSSCGTGALTETSSARTPEDLRQMAKIALSARFDSDAKSASLFLSASQEALRQAEQQELKARGLSQKILVRSVEMTKDSAIVDADRILAAGDVRSALRARFRVAFEETEPNELNPYGFRLALAEPVAEKPEARP